MSDVIEWCKCGFKAVKGQYKKTDGMCPVCEERILPAEVV